MSKEEELKGLRQSVKPPMKPPAEKVPVDCIAASHWLSERKRKATDMRDVEVIEWLFDHFNLRPGRFHDDPKTEIVWEKKKPAAKPKAEDSAPWEKLGLSRRTYFRRKSERTGLDPKSD